MSDKKVGRFSRSPISPTEQMERALSDPGTVNVADMRHDKGKAATAQKFREREERWRREQSMHDQQAAKTAEQPERRAEQGGEAAEQQGGEEGGEA